MDLALGSILWRAVLTPDSCEVSLRGAVLLAPVPPATGQGMNAAATGGLSAAPGSIQDHSGDVHIHSPHLVTDSLQSSRDGGGEISLSLSVIFKGT